jgi:hypothetical protein
MSRTWRSSLATGRIWRRRKRKPSTRRLKFRSFSFYFVKKQGILVPDEKVAKDVLKFVNF